MALIPRKSKASFISADALSFGTLLMLLSVILISSTLVTDIIHESLQIVAIPLLVLAVIFLLFPNRNNHGKNGAQRIMLCAKYYLKKIKGWVNK